MTEVRKPSTGKYFAQKLETIESYINFTKGGPAPKHPLGVFLEVSNVCDFKCVMCSSFSSFNPYRQDIVRLSERGFLKKEDVLRVAEELKHSLWVHLFGYGEPTINPDFEEIVRLASEYEVAVDFFTHGKHLSEKLVKLLVDTGVYEMTVSFSGATKQEYENVYRGGEFERTLAGLARMRDYKAATGRKYPLVTINSLAFEHHVEKFDQFVELMARHGVSRINLMPLFENANVMRPLAGHAAVMRPAVDGPVLARAQEIAARYGVIVADTFSSQKAETEEEYRKLKAVRSGLSQEELAKTARIPVEQFPEAEKSVRRATDANADASFFKTCIDIDKETPADAALRMKTEKLREKSRGHFYCHEPFRTMYVRYDGFVKPCCNMPNYAPALGNVHTHSPERIWNGSAYKMFRDSILDDSYPMASCKDCLCWHSAPPVDIVTTTVPLFCNWYSEVYGEKFYHGLTDVYLHSVYSPLPSYDYGTEIILGAKVDPAFKAYGWRYPEENVTWTAEKSSVLAFRVKATARPLKLKIKFSPLVSPKKPSQKVLAFVNDSKVAEWDAAMPGVYEADIPPGLAKERFVLRLEVPGADTPTALGLWQWEQVLGIAVSSVVVAEVN